MQSIHEQSAALKADGLGECPVFATSCPFKNVTSAGTPLVAELEYRTWSIFAEQDLGTTAGGAVASATAESQAAKQMPASLGGADEDDRLLSKDLKFGTKKSHRAAENVQFVKNFIKGKIDREVYKHMVVSLWHTYTALEDELRKNADDPVYGKCSLALVHSASCQRTCHCPLLFRLWHGQRNSQRTRSHKLIRYTTLTAMAHRTALHSTAHGSRHMVLAQAR
jgi:hypothetical protein